jgi:hypothetical protein
MWREIPPIATIILTKGPFNVGESQHELVIEIVKA